MSKETTTPQPDSSKEVLKDKWEVSPYKAGLVGIEFNDPLTSNTICQVFGANPNPIAQKICDQYNNYQPLVDALDGVLTNWHSNPSNFKKKEPEYITNVRTALNNTK